MCLADLRGVADGPGELVVTLCGPKSPRLCSISACLASTVYGASGSEGGAAAPSAISRAILISDLRFAQSSRRLHIKKKKRNE